MRSGPATIQGNSKISLGPTRSLKSNPFPGFSIESGISPMDSSLKIEDTHLVVAAANAGQ